MIEIQREFPADQYRRLGDTFHDQDDREQSTELIFQINKDDHFPLIQLWCARLACAQNAGETHSPKKCKLFKLRARV